MSLRRSARNAAKSEAAHFESSEAVNEMTKAKKNNAASKKTRATFKKAVMPLKHKVLGTPPTTTITKATSVPNHSEIEAKAKPTPNVANQLDVTRPVEVFTLPDKPLTSSAADSPSTPLPNKRRRKADTVSPVKSTPFTPTPPVVGLLTGSHNVAQKDVDHMLDDLASLNRPADPHATNAPVLTPNGSQVVVANSGDGESPAKKRKAKDLPPDVGSPNKGGSSTVDTLLKDAEEFLISVDESGKLERLIKKQRCKVFSPEGLREAVDPFTALSSGIIGQQVRCIHHYSTTTTANTEAPRQIFRGVSK